MENTTDILNSDKNFALLSDYFAPQERDRLGAILEEVLVSAQGRLSGMKNYEDWNKVVRPAVLKELDASAQYFGFKNLSSRFNVESFLKNYYNSNALKNS